MPGSGHLLQAGHGTLPKDLGVEEFFNHLWLVDKADDPHLSLALGASERVGLASCSWDCWVDFARASKV